MEPTQVRADEMLNLAEVEGEEAKRVMRGNQLPLSCDCSLEAVFRYRDVDGDPNPDQRTQSFLQR